MDKEEKGIDDNIISIQVDSDEELEGSWLFELLTQDNIPYTKTYVSKEFLYELEKPPKCSSMDEFFFRYTIDYDGNDNHHLFNKYLVHQYSKLSLEFENMLGDDNDKTEE